MAHKGYISLLVALLLVALSFSSTHTAVAQTYPNKAVHIIVPYPPGGAVDVAARKIAQKLNEQTGQPFVVENKPGASGTIGTVQVARSVPNGYTLMANDIRTVEGDMGIRSNAQTILQFAGSMTDIGEIFPKYDRKWAEERGSYLSMNTEILSTEEREKQFDRDLARAAVKIAADRHVGHLEAVYTVSDPVHIQTGKDMTRVQSVIGTGGIFLYGSKPGYILDGARRFAGQELFLKPQKPEDFIDSRYILFAAGLLGQLDEDLALSVLKRYLQKVG